MEYNYMSNKVVLGYISEPAAENAPQDIQEHEMEHDHPSHETLIQGITSQTKDILDASDQAIYIYLDDNHWVCNQKFASLLGYRTPEELAQVKEPPVQTWVDSKSQRTLVNTYREAMQHMTGSTIPITWKKKSGGTVDSTMILVPLAYQGHMFAMHFIS
jgi:PAS domain-containing protein